MPAAEHPLAYTSQFWEDIADTIRYITFQLCNPQAAQKLKDDTEAEILKFATLPLKLKPYFTDEVTQDEYYAIRISNFTAFFVIVGETYEFRRFLYSARNFSDILHA